MREAGLPVFSKAGIYGRICGLSAAFAASVLDYNPARLAKPRSDILDRLQYFALRVIAMTLHAWPVSVSLRAADLVGDLYYFAVGKHRRRAQNHLRRSLPQLTAAERARIARTSMRQLFRLGVETIWTPRLIRLETVTHHVRLKNFQNTLGLMLNNPRGLIMLTGHYGNWEVLGYALATMGFSTVSVARPLDNPYISRYIFGIREQRGQKIIAKKGATPDVVATLEGKGFVGLVADQNAGPKGIFVDFFGRRASTYKSIALLAMQYEVPIVVGYARRLQGVTFEFDVGTQDIIYPHDWAGVDDPVRYITQRYTAAIESMVRDDPGQYLWVHRRWKTRPKGEPPEAESD
jgi:Kdo2-lipid IVA lauroyltransferase/acyltransferase